MEDFLVTFGSEVKASSDGRFTGYLVRFSSAESPDLANEFFTKDTDFGISDGAKTPIYFNHRLPIRTRSGAEIIVKQKIGEGSMTMDEMGILLDAIIWNRDNYEKAIIEAGRKNMLGWSSGTAPHLVDYERVGKSRFIKSWPLGLDASLTPMPCEPTNNAISLRSYSSLKFVPLDDDADEDFDENPMSEAERLVPTYKSIDIDTHSRLAASALKDLTSRFRRKYEARLKDRRKFSDIDCQRIASVLEQCAGWEAATADLKTLLAEATGTISDTEKRVRDTEYFKQRHSARRL